MPPPKIGEPLGGTSTRPFALTFREVTLVRLDRKQHKVRLRRDGRPRQLREPARRVTGAPFITLLDGEGKRFKKLDNPIDEMENFECTVVAQHPVITVFFFPASACWPVWPGQSTVLFTLRLHTCTGPFNWGKAHFAGEKVRHPVRTKRKKSLNQQKTTTETKAQPATATRNPRPGSQLHEPRKKHRQHTPRDFTLSNKVRLNVHCHHTGNAIIHGSQGYTDYKVTIYKESAIY